MLVRRLSLSGLALCAALCALAAAPARAVPITVYDDLNSSGAYDVGEELSGGLNGDGGGTYDLAIDLTFGLHDIAATSLAITFEFWDNNFELSINGVTVVPVDPGDPAVFTPGIDQPWLANSNSLPRLYILIDESAIAFEAALTSSATSMTSGLVYNQPTSNPVFVSGQNQIQIVNPDGPGPDALLFTIAADSPLQLPEPGSGALLALGLAGLAAARRRRARA